MQYCLSRFGKRKFIICFLIFTQMFLIHLCLFLGSKYYTGLVRKQNITHIRTILSKIFLSEMKSHSRNCIWKSQLNSVVQKKGVYVLKIVHGFSLLSNTTDLAQIFTDLLLWLTTQNMNIHVAPSEAIIFQLYQSCKKALIL